ncbi:hypothetical protein SAMN05421803_103164 [Nocardiopsis flavescens]|uniref:Histone acetyltransferase Rv0428c-like SH3 domain-containing protein n=2 Tax=Nocardiopsis flavescens TaxID=758803 RepID=A0A1M6FVC6_9ACTN|nr:hypothetical protein SAMN05421803_103164 [Nocardiopsis flavescens]
MAGRLVHRITPEDTGSRVSIRIHLPGGGFTDIVGVLESWNDGVLAVRRRDGREARVEESSIAGSRVVPDVPPRRRGTAGGRHSSGPPG